MNTTLFEEQNLVVIWNSRQDEFSHNNFLSPIKKLDEKLHSQVLRGMSNFLISSTTGIHFWLLFTLRLAKENFYNAVFVLFPFQVQLELNSPAVFKSVKRISNFMPFQNETCWHIYSAENRFQ